MVYLTTDVSAKGLLAVYEALEPSAAESVAMKLSEQTDPQSLNADELMKLLAEHGNMAAETLKGQVLYIAVLDHFSIGDVSNDVAILSSYDPVSLDQACVDLVNMSEECQMLALHIASCNSISTLTQAEQMGLGIRTYAFLSIDN